MDLKATVWFPIHYELVSHYSTWIPLTRLHHKGPPLTGECRATLRPDKGRCTMFLPLRTGRPTRPQALHYKHTNVLQINDRCHRLEADITWEVLNSIWSHYERRGHHAWEWNSSQCLSWDGSPIDLMESSLLLKNSWPKSFQQLGYISTHWRRRYLMLVPRTKQDYDGLRSDGTWIDVLLDWGTLEYVEFRWDYER